MYFSGFFFEGNFYHSKTVFNFYNKTQNLLFSNTHNHEVVGALETNTQKTIGFFIYPAVTLIRILLIKIDRQTTN